eukprot:TRINITY_DN31430_c0_g1_i1.p1 TRINITY_DN31430_c0_g1~~TRINITY_DN31430_c0_g1_i1.p1  ORF type:complete len:378 (+),score=29.62 TRINITY_DN31430_c0_g1_i1:103-1134(+)
MAASWTTLRRPRRLRRSCSTEAVVGCDCTGRADGRLRGTRRSSEPPCTQDSDDGKCDSINTGLPDLSKDLSQAWQGTRESLCLRERCDLVASCPCYPLPHGVNVEVNDCKISVVCHHSVESRGTKVSVSGVLTLEANGASNIVVMLPGFNGGVGPCRRDGVTFDDNALFPVLARRLVKKHGNNGPTSCYRVSWSHKSPSIWEASRGIVGLVLKALGGKRTQPCKVFLIGHSFGVSVALASAVMLRSVWGDRGINSVGGIVSLAAELTSISCVVRELASIPKIFFHGALDDVTPISITGKLCELMAPEPMQLTVLPDCGHDLLKGKDQLVDDILRFLDENAAMQ